MTTTQYDKMSDKDVLDHSSAKLRDALVSLEQTQTTGAAIAVELQRHDEILDRCDKNADEIDVQLNVSERLLRGMSGFWGRVVNAFTKDNTAVAFQPLLLDGDKKKSSSDSENSTSRAARTNDKSSSAAARNSSSQILMTPAAASATSTKATKISNATKEIDEQLARDDENLDLILSSLRNVKAQAHDLNRSLAQQETKLDILTKKVDRSEARVQKQNHKIWKMS